MTHVRHYGRGEYGIEGRYDERVRSVCRGNDERHIAPTPGMRWEPAARAWVGYIDAVATACDRLRDEFHVNVDTDDLIGHNDGDFNAIEPVKARDIRKYQAEGANFILTHGEEGCLLADDMGLGKTVQALRAMRALRFQGPSMVVCPNYAKGVWRDETKRWWPEAETIFLDGTKPEKKPELLERLAAPMLKGGGRLIVCNYDILHAWVGLFTDGEIKLAATGESFKPPVLLAFDEASFLQSEKSRRSKAAKELARVSRRRVGLDGTPPADKPKDLWNLVDTLSEGRFGKFFPYALRYCAARKEQVTREKAVWKFDGSSNLDELSKRVAYFTLRRTQKDVALELPEFTRQIINVEVPRGHRGPLGMALQSEAAMRRVLDLAADGKVPHVIALAESHLKADHHVVVFTHRRAIAEAIAKAFGDAGAFIHGGMSQTKRDAVLQAKPALLAATLDTAGRGLNDLVYYDVAIFAELHWVPSVLAQGEKRPHRPGQTRAVLIQYVIAEGTADELIRDGCIRKLQTRVSVLGKLDDGLLEQLDGDMRAGGVAALRALAESLGMT